MKKFVFILHLAIFCFIATQSAFSFENYTLNLDFLPSEKTISGNIEIKFHADKDSDEIYIALYPNIFSSRDEKLNDVTFEWVYPKSFDNATIEIFNENIVLKENIIKILKKEGLNKPTTNNVIVYKLDSPLKANEEITFTADFKTKIPLKFGSFGYYMDIFSLNGGFYPRLLTAQDIETKNYFPHLSDYKINIKNGDGYKLLLNGNLLGVENLTDGKYSYEAIMHYPSIIISKSFTSSSFSKNVTNSKSHPERSGDTETKKQKTTFTFYQSSKDEELNKWVNESIDRVIPFLNSENFPLATSVKIAAIPLRGELAINGDGVIYISDRIFKILSILRYFHDVQFVRAILSYSVNDLIKKRETDSDFFWVREAVSWFWSEKYQTYIEKKYGKIRDVRAIKLLQYLRFIPAVQEALLAPEYPFSYSYFDFIYHNDYLKEDPINFRRIIPNGRVITEKLRDQLEINEYNQVFSSYLYPTNRLLSENLDKSTGHTRESGDPAIQIDSRLIGYDSSVNLNFRDNLTAQLKRDMDWFFSEWLSELKKENFSIANISKEKKNSTWDIKVTVTREAKEKLKHEAVTLLMKENGGQRHYLTLISNEPKHEYILNTKNKINLVQLDPKKRLNDKTEKDNRVPAEYLLMMPAANLSLSIFAGDLDGFIFLQLEKMYNPVNSYTFLGIVSPSSYGVSLGYGRWFGRLIDFLRMTHFFALDFNFRKLKEGYIKWAIDNNTDPEVSPETIYIPTDSGITNSIELGYSFASTVSRRNPQGGWGAYFFTDLSSKYILSDYDYILFGFTFSKLFQIFDEHILALSVRYRDSFNDVPSQNQFSLGGIYNMRGIPVGYSKYVGKKRVLFACEYRHVLVRELDINIFNLARFRKIQGAIYTDAGSVADTVFEQREKKADPLFTYNGGYDRLIDYTNYNTDVGYSLRLFFDAFGVRSTLLRFDIAKQLNNFNDESIQFYVTFDQAF